MKSQTPAMKLILLVASLESQLVKKIDQKLGIHGISFTEYRVIEQLYHASGETMRRIDLAESVGLSASGVTRLLSAMQKIGLVQKERNPRDARVSLVQLTDTGKQIFHDASTSFQESAAALTEPLNVRQIKDFLSLIELLG